MTYKNKEFHDTVVLIAGPITLAQAIAASLQAWRVFWGSIVLEVMLLGLAYWRLRE